MKFLKRLFSIYYWIAFTLITLIFAPIALVLYVIWGRRDPRRWINCMFSGFWSSFYLHLSPFWKLRISGKEKLDPDTLTLYIANHQSIFDIFLLFRLYIPFHWVSKKENLNIPLIGWNVRFVRTICFDREDQKDVLRMVREAIKRLKEGISLLIFPEGERTQSGKLLPFLEGAFIIAKKANVRIQPIVLNGGYDIIPPFQGLFNPIGNMTIDILDPIPVEVVQEKSASELCEMCWKIFAERLPHETRVSAYPASPEVPQT